MERHTGVYIGRRDRMGLQCCLITDSHPSQFSRPDWSELTAVLLGDRVVGGPRWGAQHNWQVRSDTTLPGCIWGSPSRGTDPPPVWDPLTRADDGASPEEISTNPMIKEEMIF